MSFSNLEIWKNSRSLVINIHEMSLTKLPKFEMFEEGSQIRRSVNAIKSNIVEGYGPRRYKQEFVKFLTYSLSSCDETNDHLETLFDTKSLRDKPLYDAPHQRLEHLGKQLNLLIQSVERSHVSEK